jgi:hypothetical protein
VKLAHIKADYNQPFEMATVFGVRMLGILLANSARLFRAPEERRKLAGGGARAQPQGLVEEDF